MILTAVLGISRRLRFDKTRCCKSLLQFRKRERDGGERQGVGRKAGSVNRITAFDQEPSFFS